MLSYRHAFHAGNFADVHKHLILVVLLRAMQRKHTPFLYLETHAGAGMYEFGDEAAQKTAEFRSGIGRLWRQPASTPELADYLALVCRFNPDGELRRYPGSPLLAYAATRAQDRLVLCELHGSDYPLLKRRFAGESRVAVHHQDGLLALKAFLPPKEKRLLALIDPPYERSEEYGEVTEGLVTGYQRWPAGTFAVWYPLLARRDLPSLPSKVGRSGLRKVLQLEVQVNVATGLRGSGLLIVNPPWQLAEQAQQLMPLLADRLDQGMAQWRVDWLVPE